MLKNPLGFKWTAMLSSTAQLSTWTRTRRWALNIMKWIWNHLTLRDQPSRLSCLVSCVRLILDAVHGRKRTMCTDIKIYNIRFPGFGEGTGTSCQLGKPCSPPTIGCRWKQKTCSAALRLSQKSESPNNGQTPPSGGRMVYEHIF